MMKMHGVDDGPLFVTQYVYFLCLALVYSWMLIAFGSVIGLSFFTKTSYSLQAVFCECR